ncbi:MAG: alpha/beta fold hydrolase [Candidatus Moranbacteria bacterium]|nr:alpha/beta fold hydrolase [Candidatus Moranbacteria bacterium]
MRNNVLIIHGFGARGRANFFPWLKNELEKKDFKVMLPDLPDPYQPKMQEWIKALSNFKADINQKTIVVGHSLGGAVAPFFVDQLNREIKGLFLAAPANPAIEKHKQHSRIEQVFSQEDLERLRKIILKPIDWSKLNKKVKLIKAYFSTDDPLIPIQSQEFYLSKKIQVQVLENRGHLLDYTFPEILKDILRLTNS